LLDALALALGERPEAVGLEGTDPVQWAASQVLVRI
jgi:hypothetical protein